MIDRRIHSW